MTSHALEKAAKTQNEVILYIKKLFSSSCSLVTFCVQYCSGPETAKISLFLSGFFRWNSFGKKYCSKHRNWTLRSSLSKTVLMSYSEKSPGYLAQMQNWPSVWPKNSWGGGRWAASNKLFRSFFEIFWALTTGWSKSSTARHILLLIKVQAKNMNNKVHIKSEEFQKGFSQIFKRELYWKELGNVIARWSFDPILII